MTEYFFDFKQLVLLNINYTQRKEILKAINLLQEYDILKKVKQWLTYSQNPKLFGAVTTKPNKKR